MVIENSGEGEELISLFIITQIQLIKRITFGAQYVKNCLKAVFAHLMHIMNKYYIIFYYILLYYIILNSII